ncbi:ABC transporter ATP-binding protein [Candidatus Gottesmanbacteria bacterium]|nr:ABC transporter ATP-binding protein [Candidatus Gottesmanbacteria bacterium]
MLKVKNLSVSLDGKKILENVSLEIKKGELCVLMGPNGAGKSTLGRAIVKNSEMDGEIFLGFQQPVTVPGVNYLNFLRLAYRKKLDPLEFYKYLKEKAKILEIPEEFLTRSLNDQFSGGEKKRMELLQALVLEPKYAILDEPDTGTDVDSLKLIAKGIKVLQTRGTGILLITHYQRLLKYLKPARVYVLINGKIAATGDKKLIARIEKNGYANFPSNSPGI